MCKEPSGNNKERKLVKLKKGTEDQISPVFFSCGRSPFLLNAVNTVNVNTVQIQ